MGKAGKCIDQLIAWAIKNGKASEADIAHWIKQGFMDPPRPKLDIHYDHQSAYMEVEVNPLRSLPTYTLRFKCWIPFTSTIDTRLIGDWVYDLGRLHSYSMDFDSVDSSRLKLYATVVIWGASEEVRRKLSDWVDQSLLEQGIKK